MTAPGLAAGAADVAETTATATTAATATATASTVTHPGADEIQVYQTSPNRLVMHRIEDHELESLVNISSPITLTLAGAFGGGFLGILSSAITAYSHVATKSVTAGDLTAVLTCGACAVGVVVAGVYAFKGQQRAARKLQDIRGRTASPLVR